MYWYLKKKEERPRAALESLARKYESGEYDKLPEDEKKDIVKTALAWEQSKGKYLYDPPSKLYKWFLMPHWIKGIRGGNQSGKSTGCVVDFVMQIEGWHPLQKANMERLIEEAFDPDVVSWLKKLHKRKIFFPDPPVRMRCITVDFSNFVDKVLGPAYEGWATRELLGEVAYMNDKKRRITWQNGSFVEFMTYEQSVLSHGGSARHGIQHDEEPPSGLFAQSKMRVSTTRGRLTVGMTAEQGVTWTEEELWRPGLSHPTSMRTSKGQICRSETVYASELTTYENPIMTQAMVDKIKQSCRDEAEIEIRIYGKGTPRGGLVYPMWKAEPPWVIDPFQIPEVGGYLVLAIDPHPQLPHACLWAWIDPDGFAHPIHQDKPNIYQVAELFEPCNISELAAMIREKEMYEIGRQHDFVLCDPYAWNRDQNNPKTLAEQMQEVGIMAMPASKDRDSGIIKVKEMLSLQFGQELPEDFEKSVVIQRKFPQIMTYDTLSTLIWERKKYRWRKPRQRFTEDIKVVQKPVDKDDHMMENEYRIALFAIDGDFMEVDLQDEPLIRPITIAGNQMDVDFNQDFVHSLEIDYLDSGE